VFDIIDNHTKTVIGTAKTLQSASRKCDRLDLNYGAHRYSYKRQAEPQKDNNNDHH
jgi:hypothetical protein